MTVGGMQSGHRGIRGFHGDRRPASGADPGGDGQPEEHQRHHPVQPADLSHFMRKPSKQRLHYDRQEQDQGPTDSAGNLREKRDDQQQQSCKGDDEVADCDMQPETEPSTDAWSKVPPPSTQLNRPKTPYAIAPACTTTKAAIR